MQIQVAGLRNNELPKFLAEDQDEKTHSIIVDDPLNPTEPLVISLSLKGITSYLLSRKPRVSEYEDESIPHIDMTSKAPVWDPSETIFSEQEDVMTDFRGEVIKNDTITRGQWIINFLSTSKYDAVDFTDDDNFYKALNAKVNVGKVGVSKGINGFTSKSLFHKLLISPDLARRTVHNTTQRGIRTILHQSLSRQFNTNDQEPRYNRLQYTVFEYTIHAGTVSRRGNRCVQVYSTEFIWSRAHPMKRKGYAHETLSLLFKKDGVSPKMMMNESKEKNLV